MTTTTTDIRRLCDYATSATATLRCCRPGDALIEPLEAIAETVRAGIVESATTTTDAAREALIKQVEMTSKDWGGKTPREHAELDADMLLSIITAANPELHPAGTMAELARLRKLAECATERRSHAIDKYGNRNAIIWRKGDGHYIVERMFNSAWSRLIDGPDREAAEAAFLVAVAEIEAPATLGQPDEDYEVTF